MKQIRFLFPLLACAFLLLVSSCSERPAKELERMRGEWVGMKGSPHFSLWEERGQYKVTRTAIVGASSERSFSAGTVQSNPYRNDSGKRANRHVHRQGNGRMPVHRHGLCGGADLRQANRPDNSITGRGISTK